MTALLPVARAVLTDPKDAHPTDHLPSVGGRLLQFAENWEILGPDSWVRQVIRQGYKIEFSSRPPARGLLKSTPVPQARDQRLALENEISGLLEKRAIYIVEEFPSRLYRSSFFLTPKKPDTWRPIINLKPLNKAYIRPTRFRMETLASVIPSLVQGSWATSIDLKDAYLHIPIHPSHHRFLAFRYKEVDYCFRALPFGLSTAPRVFTRVTRAVLAFLRRRGIMVFAYLDDWLLVGRSAQESHRITTFTVTLLQNLGWIVNLQKSSLTPSQIVTYLGAVLDFTTGIATPSAQRVQTLVDMSTEMLTLQSAPARQWLRLLGLMASMVDVIPFCRLYMRPIQIHLLNHFTPSKSPLSKRVPVVPSVREHLTWWTLQHNVASGRSFKDDRASTIITTDASLTGWGAVWETETLSGFWNQEESSQHINLLELSAVHRAISSWGHRLAHLQVTILCDNSTTVSYINRQGGTKSISLCLKTWDLLHLCQQLDIHIRATHLAGVHNVMADALSRGKLLQSEWSLSQVWANHIFDLYDKPMIDLFATPVNHKLPLYCTRFFHRQAWATDALALSWNNLYLYAFPPWCLILRVLLKLRQSSNVMLLLVAPFWPNQPWFPLLLEMLIDRPFLFPLRPNLLTQAKGRIVHQRLQHVQLAAWKLSPDASLKKAFLNRLQKLPQAQGGDPRYQLMTQDWPDLGTGLPTKMWIPWKLQ